LSETFTGVVQRHGSKNWGDKVFNSFTLSGQQGWFNLGEKKPPDVGTTISFEAKPNAKGFLQVDTKTIQYRTDGEAQTADVAKALPKSAEEKGFWGRKEDREVRNDHLRELGASRNTAIAIIDLMIKNEAIKLPAAAAKKEEFLWTVLDKYTQKLMGLKDSIDAEEAVPATSTEEEEEWN
jgi:hypothetical protein